jgi:hypothetical protein
MDSDDYWEKSDVKGFNFAEAEVGDSKVISRWGFFIYCAV